MARKPRVSIGASPKLQAPAFWENDSNPVRLLSDLFAELGRANIDAERLPEPQRYTLQDIKDAIGYPRSEGFTTLFDTNRLDHSALKVSQYTVRRPHVSLQCFLTSKRNLSVKWVPYHIDLNHHEMPAPEWTRPPLGLHGFTRPNDELLFIRNFGRLEEINTSREGQLKALDVYLLALGIVVWNDLKAFVSEHLDVQIQSEPKIKFADPSNYHLLPLDNIWSKDKDQVPAGFEIENKIDSERLRLENMVKHFQKQHSIKAETFWKVINDAGYEGDGLNFDRRSRALKKLGASAMHPSVVRDARNDLLKAIDARIWGPKKTVVQLRPNMSPAPPSVPNA